MGQFGKCLRVCMAFGFSAVILLSATAPAAAQTPVVAGTVAGFGSALTSWAAKHKVEKAFVVVRRGGKLAYSLGVGGADAKQPVHLASLSKAITAACVATLVRDRKLAFDAPLAKTLAKFFAANGKPGDPRLMNVTLGQLITHRAGFPDGNGDPITGPNLRDYLRTNTAKEPPKPSLIMTALKGKLATEPGAQYGYSNTGYALLGAIIEEAAGKPYAAYCRDAVLTPAGATGELEPGWQVMSAYGGWRLRGEDYLKFFDLLDPADGRLGPATKEWVATPAGKAIAGDSTTWYSLGMITRKSGNSVTQWHWGQWNFNLVGGKDGPLKANFATFAVRVADGTEWFVHLQPSVPGGPRIELDRALFEAYRAVKVWDDR